MGMNVWVWNPQCLGDWDCLEGPWPQQGLLRLLCPSLAGLSGSGEGRG